MTGAAENDGGGRGFWTKILTGVIIGVIVAQIVKE